MRSGATSRFLVVCFCLVLTSTVFAIQKPRPEDRVLDNFDSRLGVPLAASPEIRAALQRVDALVPGGLRARFNPLSGGVRLLSSEVGAITPRAVGNPAAIAQAFLAAHPDLLGLSAADLSTLVKASEYSGLRETITHLLFEQVISGVGVWQADVGVHINREGQIVFLTSTVVPARAPINSLNLTAGQAVQQAAAEIRPELSFTPQLKSGPSGADQFTVFEPGPFAKELTARLVLFPTFQGLRLGWQTLVEPVGFPQGYITLVDASNGQLLLRQNIYQYAEGVGNVHQSNATMTKDARLPDEHPAGDAASGPSDPPNGCPPVNDWLNRDLNTQYRDNATVLFDTGRLAGNNVHVWRSNTGNEGAQGTQDGGGVWHFDFGFNTASGIETHLFFASNHCHDFFYDLGFDEPSRNFQEDNFGRGGAGSDSLNANARAPGRNNANFSTPADGSNPTMNMFLWDGAGCWSQDVDGDGSQDLDGDLDYDIIIHEYHHGVTHRLNTSFGGNEAGAMGEGGGDFFGYSVNGDTKLAEYSSPPNGIRQVNAKTYGDWFCFFGFFCEVHDNGEIWANVLWDLRERYRVDQVGGTEASGINELHQTYINGLKLSPANPTMLEMRDSMLQDDLNRHPNPSAPGGSDNYCRLWEEFAGRGMGVNALDTKDTGNNTVVENFEKPSACTTPPAPPGAPSNLVATAITSTQINLTWTDNSNNEDGFKIERCTGPASSCDATPANFAQIAQVGANVVTYSDMTVEGSTTYSYRVRAFNAGGNSAYSNTDDATTPAPPLPPLPPSNLVATKSDTNPKSQINLTWTDNSADEDGFKIERCTGAGCTGFTQIAQVGANVTSFQNTGLAANTTYRYRVRAFNGGGNSAYSNEAEATTDPLTPPAAPSDLTATAVSSSQINLAWTDNSSNEDGFKIERCTGAGCTNFAQIAQVGANVTSFQNTGLSPNTTYRYRVRAFNGDGDSAYSNVAEATTPQVPPAAPSNLTATAQKQANNVSIRLNWTDNSNNEDFFDIERCTGSAASCAPANFVPLTSVGANTTTFTDTTVARRTTYSYRVKARNTAPGGGDSTYSNIATATTK